MPHLRHLYRQIAFVMRIRPCLNRDYFGHIEPHLSERINLCRIVGEQAQGAHSKMLEHRFANFVFASVCCEPQLLVCLNSIGAAVLQRIRLYLIEQTDAAALLAQIKDHTAPETAHFLHRILQLWSTIAAQAKQAITRKAFTMDPAQHRLVARYVAADKRDMLNGARRWKKP